MSAGAFAKIAGARSTGAGDYITDGNYKYLVEKIVVQNGHSGECFVAELRVVESASNGATTDDGKPIQPNPVGATVSVVQNLTKFESAPGNAKALVVGALAGLGYTEEQVTPEVMAFVCSDKNPLRGLALRNSTCRGTNKGKTNPANRGKALTLNRWTGIAQTEPEMLAQRQWLDSNVATQPTQAQAPAAPATQSSEQPAQSAPATKSAGLLGGFLGK